MLPTIAILMSTHAQMGDTDETTGTFAAEVAHAVQVFDDAGFQVVFVSREGGAIPLYGTDYDTPTETFLADAEWTDRLHSSLSIEDVAGERIDAVYIAGGHGAMFDLAQPGDHADWIGDAWDAGLPVAAVCHGPAGLVSVTDSSGQPIVAGRHVAGFTNDEEVASGHADAMPFLLADRLTELGGRHVGHGTWQGNVVVDGRLITGQNPASARGMAQAVVRALTSGE